MFRQVYDNGVAGIHIMGSNNFTFEATIADECFGESCVLEGEGNVGTVDGQQPIEVIIETSTDVKFQDMRVQSANGESSRLRRLEFREKSSQRLREGEPQARDTIFVKGRLKDCCYCTVCRLFDAHASQS